MEKIPSTIGQYCVHRKIGAGGQAKVYLVSKSSQVFAAKVYEPGQTKVELFQKEILFLNKIKNPFMINIVESLTHVKVSWSDEQDENRNVIILEYAEGGQMFDFISKDGAFSSTTCKKIFKQLLSVIEAMKQAGVCHRDLKPDNLLFDKHFNLKVADFGLSANLEDEFGEQILTEKVGTQGYRSPQMERGKYLGHDADIFAAGVILFLMYSGAPPFLSTRFSDKIYKLIRQGNFEKFWNIHEKKKIEGFYQTEFKKLMNLFFSHDPSKRPTLEDLQNIPWLQVDDKTEQLKQQLSQKLETISQEDSSKIQLRSLIDKIQAQSSVQTQANQIDVNQI